MKSNFILFIAVYSLNYIAAQEKNGNINPAEANGVNEIDDSGVLDFDYGSIDYDNIEMYDDEFNDFESPLDANDTEELEDDEFLKEMGMDSYIDTGIQQPEWDPETDANQTSGVDVETDDVLMDNQDSKNSTASSSINECNVVEYVFSDSSVLDNIEVEYCLHNVSPTGSSLELKIDGECGTTLICPEKLVHGKVEGRVKMAPGSGAVTALILMNIETGDEIDLEWVGIDSTTVQSMYFVGGQRVDQEAQNHKASGDMSEGFYNYAIEITPDAINWYVDEVLVRTLENDNSGNFPSSANEVRFGVWNGSAYSEWAGDMGSSPDSAGVFESIKITHYC
ncbi:hypothetical protein BB561_003371 [Smittium simulii]|uniref:GH16 domain-containing protein n=1 Tax=Smittium simulii TaxID=133385 RepID=A0A2T9YLR2_9FUNG|nr:hypothetical protein BB561_003371 [Smittium simulii]